MKVFIQAVIALGLLRYGYDVSDVCFAEEDFDFTSPDTAAEA